MDVSRGRLLKKPVSQASLYRESYIAMKRICQNEKIQSKKETKMNILLNSGVKHIACHRRIWKSNEALAHIDHMVIVQDPYTGNDKAVLVN